MKKYNIDISLPHSQMKILPSNEVFKMKEWMKRYLTSGNS